MTKVYFSYEGRSYCMTFALSINNGVITATVLSIVQTNIFGQPVTS